MNTVTCKIPCGVLETESQTIKSGQDKRDWAQYSQAIAVLMSRRMSTDACRENELHPAIHIQDAERAKEYVVGNYM